MPFNWDITKLHTVEGDDAQISGLAVDNEGNIYFTVFLEGLFQLSKNNKLECLVRDETLGGAEMSGVVRGNNNIIYSCDLNNHKIVSYDIQSGEIGVVAGCGTEGHKDGNTKEAMFRFPEALAVDQDNNIYISEYRSVRKINTTAQTVETIAELRPLTQTRRFDRLAGLAVDKNGTVHGADYFNHCIRQIKDGTMTILAGAYGKEGHRDRKLTDSSFSCPNGLALHHDGSLLVADNNGIRRIDFNSNRVTTLLPGNDNLKELSSIAIDQQGVIYVSTIDSIYKLEHTWGREKFVWMGYMKESPENCLLATLPKSIIQHIASYLKKKKQTYIICEQQPHKKVKYW